MNGSKTSAPLSLATAPTKGSVLLPDIAEESRVQIQGTLDRVGMSHIEVPVLMPAPGGQGATQMISAKADAYVNLIDPKAKGIHMSRLFLQLQDKLENELLSPELLEKVLSQFVESHENISDSAFIKLSFEYLIKRKALKSENSGWRSYPVTYRASLVKGVPRMEVGVEVAYSSTCPCSAALARQLIQEKFKTDFSTKAMLSFDEVSEWIAKDSSILATPHSQRSVAHIQVVCDRAGAAMNLMEIIDGVEDTLKTAVQAAVKRADEQEFARLNGQNLMFCEDAARRLKSWLESQKRIVDYRVEARHVESLHPHDAVSIVTKGVEGGFRP